MDGQSQYFTINVGIEPNKLGFCLLTLHPRLANAIHLTACPFLAATPALACLEKLFNEGLEKPINCDKYIGNQKCS